MKAGNRVSYVDERGKWHPAEVVAVPASGPSGFKVLDLDVDGSRVEGVLHEGDSPDGRYWTFSEPPRRSRRKK